MTDTVIKGSGNSRTLKTVPNAAALYPTYDAFIQAFAAGELPIDLGPLNPAGLNVLGTDLNKAALLKDETAALYGKDATATPDDILVAIRSLISTAMGRAQVSIGNYTGNGGAQSLNFNIQWKFALIWEEIKYGFVYKNEPPNNINIRNGKYIGTDGSKATSGNFGFNPTNTGLTLLKSYTVNDYEYVYKTFNTQGTYYRYFAIG